MNKLPQLFTTLILAITISSCSLFDSNNDSSGSAGPITNEGVPALQTELQTAPAMGAAAVTSSYDFKLSTPITTGTVTIRATLDNTDGKLSTSGTAKPIKTAIAGVAQTSLQSLEFTFASPAFLEANPSSTHLPATATIVISIAISADDDARDDVFNIKYEVIEGGVVVTETTESDFNPASIANSGVRVSSTDPDTAGITTTAETTIIPINENSDESYTMVLTSQPDGNVTINFTSSNAALTAPIDLTFTMVNWNTPQTFIVASPINANDGTPDGPEEAAIPASITYTATNDSDYGGLNGNISFSVADVNLGLDFNPTSLSVIDLNTGNIPAQSYTVALNTLPTESVTVEVDGGGVTVSPTNLTFTSSDGKTPQTITVTNIDDDNGDDSTITIMHTPNTSSGYSPGNVTISITDQDIANLSLATTTGPTTGGTPITITGINFVSGTTVTIGGNTATDITIVSSTQITATTPSGSASAPQAVLVGGASAGNFTYTKANLLTAGTISKKPGDANFTLVTIPSGLAGLSCARSGTPTGTPAITVVASETCTIAVDPTVEGTVVVNASFAGNDDYNDQTNIAYTINVVNFTEPEIYGGNTMLVGNSVNLASQVGVQGTGAPYGTFAQTWASSDNNIATVDNAGLVTGASVGEATITLTGTLSGNAIRVTKKVFVIAASNSARLTVINYANSNGQSAAPTTREEYNGYYYFETEDRFGDELLKRNKEMTDLPFLNALVAAQPAGSLNADDSLTPFMTSDDAVPKPDYQPRSTFLNSDSSHSLNKPQPLRMSMEYPTGYNTGPIKMFLTVDGRFSITYDPSATKIIGTKSDALAPGLNVKNSEWSLVSDIANHVWTYIGNANSPREGRRVLMPNGADIATFFFNAIPISYSSATTGVVFGLGAGSGDELITSASQNLTRP